MDATFSAARKMFITEAPTSHRTAILSSTLIWSRIQSPVTQFPQPVRRRSIVMPPSPLPLGSQLRQIAKAWKHDPFRPTLQMENFLASLAAHPKLTPNAVRAAQALKDDVAQKKWPMSAKLTRPASMPEYYRRLLEGAEKSAQGIGRPWWKIFFGIW